jgi:hypothetical protein
MMLTSRRMINLYKMRLKKLVFFLIWALQFYNANSQVFLSEGFETGARPEGWTEQFAQPPVHTEPWRYRNGGHSPNDNNWMVPAGSSDITRNPQSAFQGTYNAIFFKQGDNNEKTKLITPPLDLEGAVNVELSFYLCQIPWSFEGSTGWDVLRVYYKVAYESAWVLLHEYLDPVYDWELQTLILPDLSSTYYIAFEGHTRWGYGTCIDNVVVEEKGSQQLWIGDMQFNQPFAGIIPAGSTDVPVMRIDVKVFGNTGSAILDFIRVTSLNTSDSDIVPGSVKLYSTPTQTFSTTGQLGSSTSFISGIASFSGLGHSLPQGHSYLWLVVDVAKGATHGNTVDVMVAQNDIRANDILYPGANQSPQGHRIIYETLYFEDFEAVHEWGLTGEFEVNAPNGMGGSPGNPNPEAAYSGTMILGTDLSGTGAYPYNYEPSLTSLTAYTATSPAVDAYYYTDLNLFFQRHMNIEVWDKSSILASRDNGTTWVTVWESNGYINDFQWIQVQHSLSDYFSRTGNLKIRFQLGPTDGQNNYSGWNIDDIFLTGEFISKDVGVSQWISPVSGCGHTATEPVVVRIENFGGADITDPVPVAYSFDGGTNWTTDICNEIIPVGGSVIFTFPTTADLSVPGIRPEVLVRTLLPGDQFGSNDQISTQLFIVPTYTPSYEEDFEEDGGFWHTSPGSIWAHGTPGGAVIGSASSGENSWVTGLTGKYGDIISDAGSIIFEDNFETPAGWSFSGEWERSIPVNIPYWAYSGSYCIGTDLSGQGSLPYMYEKGITPAAAYNATSPSFDVSGYSNLKVSFIRWLNINAGDSVSLEVSPDNGTSWHTVWKNSEGLVWDEDWDMFVYDIHDSLSYSTGLKIRFSLFYSASGGDPAAGLNIDDFVLTGDLVNTAEFALNSPCFDLTGLARPVFEAMLYVDTEEDTDGATLLYSVDGGLSWLQVSNASGFDEYWNWYTGKPVAALETDGWSGQTEGWIRIRHLLPPEMTVHGSVQFRLNFKADKFNNGFDGIALDDVKIYEAPHNTGVTGILEPVSDCELPSSQKFTLRLRNFGIRDMQAGDSIRIGYRIDRAGELQIAEETVFLTSSFPAGASLDVNLDTGFDFGARGEYHVDVYTIEEDPLYYNPVANNLFSDVILAVKPEFSLGPDIYTVRPDTVMLSAYAGVDGLDYLWQDNSTDSVFFVSTEGTYSVTVTNHLGCFATDAITIYRLIADTGITGIISPLSSCSLGTDVAITVLLHNFGTDTLNINDTIFVAGQLNQVEYFTDTLVMAGNFYPGDDLEFTFSRDFDFSLPGIYHLKLHSVLRDDNDSFNDTLELELHVFGYPEINLGEDREAFAAELVLDPGPGFIEYLWQDGSQYQLFIVEQPGQVLYFVQVTDSNGCSASDSVLITLNVLDLAIDRILSPETSCALTENITVSARIINAGNLPVLSGEKIEIGYAVDDSPAVKEEITLPEDLLPGAVIDYLFAGTVVVENGNWYDFSVFLNFPGDMKHINDTILMPVGVFETPTVDLGPEFQVVTASEYILNAGEGFAGYLWQDGSANQTYTVNKPGIHSYSVTVTDHIGCTAFDQIQVYLVVPDIGIIDIIHPVTACTSGDQEHIRVAIRNHGNSNMSPAANIKAAFSVNGSTPVIENVQLTGTFGTGETIYHNFSTVADFSLPALYSITAWTIFASDLVPSNDSMTKNIEILGIPVSDIGAGQDTIVVFDEIILSATPGYISYLWQDGSAGSTFTIDEPGAGLFHVTVTDQNNCSVTDSVFVVYDVPDIGLSRIISPVSSCLLGNAETISIEISNNGFHVIPASEVIKISFSVNNEPAVTEVRAIGSKLHPAELMTLSFNTKFDFSETGKYDVIAGIEFTGDRDPSNDEASSEVDVWGYPLVDIGAGNDVINAVLPVILDAGAGHYSYLWQDSSSGSTYSVTQYGMYWVAVTNESGCEVRDTVYVDTPVGIVTPVILPGQVSIYPNPVSDILNVIIETDVARDYILELYSNHSQLVYREVFRNAYVVNGRIGVDKFAPGTYLLRIITENTPVAFKIIVK